MKKEIPEEEEEHLIIGGDWNARTGEAGPIEIRGIEVGEMRRSVDKKINEEGKLIINGLKERGWMIFNGSYEEEGG